MHGFCHEMQISPLNLCRMLFQQDLQGLPQGKVALLPVLPGGGGVIYPKPAANPTAQGFGDCALVFHQPPGIGAIIVEGKLRIDRKHGGAVDLVEGGILADTAGGSRRVNGHEFLVGHLAGAPADAAGLAIGQDLRAAGGALPGGGGAGIGVDGEVIISLPGNGFRHTDTHGSRGRGHFDRKAAAGKGRGGFLRDGGGDIVLEEGGIAEVGAVGSGTALRGEVDFFHGGISFRGV